jgi:hypothetical protein
MFGLAITFTPTYSTRVLFAPVFGLYQSTTALCEHSVYYGTGSAPANGASLTGTAVTGATPVQLPASYYTCYSPNVIVSGLTAGTTYWFDVGCVYQGSATTVVLANNSYTIVEI